MCDLGYRCANVSLPRLLCSRLMPNVRDRRQTASSLYASTYYGRGNKNVSVGCMMIVV